MTQAAQLLGTTMSGVKHRLRAGRLEADPERDGNRRMVTRASIERELAATKQGWQATRRRGPDATLIAASDVMRETGLSRLELLALCRSGVLVRRDQNLKFAIERGSYETWLRDAQ
jgi:hypothetical protein